MRPKASLSLYKKTRKGKPSIKPSTKRFLTPEKRSTSKKTRFISPLPTPLNNTPLSKRARIASPVFYAKKIVVSPLRTLKSPVTRNIYDNNEWIDVDEVAVPKEYSDHEDYVLFTDFKTKLVNASMWDEFATFMGLVSKGSYPLDNISLLLFLDTVKFYNCKTTTQMTYSSETKRFWKTGYRLFHAKFLYYMGGPKNINQFEESDRGYINPQESRINFVVPSVNTIEQFHITDQKLTTKKMPSGIIEPVLQSISETVVDKRFMLCADAKKVTSGIDKVGGDVDMFGYEDGKSLSQRQKRLSNEVEVLKKIVTDVKDTENERELYVIDNLREGCTMIGKRIKEAREMKCRQQFGLTKFMSLGGEKWRESKYVYAISALHTSLYQLNDFIRNALHSILEMSKCLDTISSSMAKVPECMTVIKGKSPNMVFLNPHYETDILETMYIIQRTPLWKEVRKMAPVTGSTIHDAVGLRGAHTQKKHILSLLEVDKERKVINEETKKKMEFGSDNEKNALATLAGIVLPTFYPQCCYVEEGCYLTQGIQKDVLLVVSPDGSIREGIRTDDQATPYKLGKVIAGVEVKCPFPKDTGITVHYSLPQYYVCQCLAEMHALNTDMLLYMSWTEESAVVFEVKFDKDLWLQIFTLISDTYDKETPKRLADTGSRVKILKSSIAKFVQTHVTFLGEFPSLKMEDADLPTTSSLSPRIFSPKTEERSERQTSVCIIEDITSAAMRGIDMINNAYELQRRKATEVMVWVLTHINRDTSTEIPCSVPIAYGLKDYKLTSDAMRSATNYVIKQCQERGIQICSLSADGQWIQMMTRDEDGSPTTRLQHQKDVWKKVQQLSKLDLVKLIRSLNKVHDAEDIENHVQVRRNEHGVLELSRKDAAIVKVKTPDVETLKLLATGVKKKNIQDITKTSKDNSSENETPNWIPQELVNVMQDSSDNTVQEVVQGIDEELAETVNKVYTKSNINTNAEIEDDADNVTNTPVDENVAEMIVKDLQLSKISHVSQSELMSMLKGKKDLTTLTHKELDIVTATLIRERKSGEVPRKSWKKKKKAELIRHIFNRSVTLLTKSKRKKNPPKLSAICEQIIRSRKMPKAILNTVYASYIYEKEYSSWVAKLPIIPFPRLTEDIEGTGTQYWYSYPEQLTGQYIGKGTDCSHNLTHLRVRSCTTGIGEVSSVAWKAVSKSNETSLNTALVEDLIDKQSVPNARTNFSEEVEEWMISHGFKDAAEVTNLVRNWYEACDTSGISAEKRVKLLLRMRNFLLNGVDFGKFPPPTRYVNKIPIVTFEGILIDIDTKLQLHAQTGPYNIRSVGSLAAETTVGILQQLNPNSSVSIKAKDVPELISSVVELMTCRLNPDRGFYMRTSRKSGVYPVHESERYDDQWNETSSTVNDGQLIIRNHAFDEDRRKKAKRKIRFGCISGPSAPSRGSLPVRQHHRKDESKILPSKRLGIDLDLK